MTENPDTPETVSYSSRSMTVAITGVSGYFGRCLLPLLEADPKIEWIIGFDKNPPPADLLIKKLIFHPVDVRDPAFESLIQDVDVLVHLAFVLMRLPGKHDIDQVNVQGTRAVITAAAQQQVRKLVITSSVVAYGLHPENPIPLSETSPLHPNLDLYYSRAKAANERYLDEFEIQHPEILVTRLRPCTVVGPRAAPDQMKSLTADTMPLVRGANPPIQLVHEDDVASALHLAIMQDLPGVYNLTSDEPRTLLELAQIRGSKIVEFPYPLVKIMMALAWRSGQSTFAPEWANLSRYPLVASNAKLKLAGWKPRFTTLQAYLDLLSSQGIHVSSAPPGQPTE